MKVLDYTEEELMVMGINELESLVVEEGDLQFLSEAVIKRLALETSRDYVTKISMEDRVTLGFVIVKHYTKVTFMKDKYFSLRRDYSEDDIASYIFFNYYKKDVKGLNMFEKYNPSITSFKYHLARSIETKFIDLLRKQTSGGKQVGYTSLDADINENQTVEDVFVVDNNIQENLESEHVRDFIISALPNNPNHIEGNSPILGKCYMTLRVLAIHLEYGYTKEDISKMFINPKTKGNLSESTVGKYIGELKNYMIENALN